MDSDGLKIAVAAASSGAGNGSWCMLSVHRGIERRWAANKKTAEEWNEIARHTNQGLDTPT